MSTAAKQLNTIQTVNMALDEALGLDPSVILLGEDIGDEEGDGLCEPSLRFWLWRHRSRDRSADARHWHAGARHQPTWPDR